MLREPFEKLIDGKVFILHKFTTRAGREIMTQYPISAVPKLGEYTKNEELTLKMMNFVCVKSDPNDIQLVTWDLIDNHVPSWETQIKIEGAMIEYNFSFFQQGGISTLLDGFTEMLPQWIIKMSTLLSEQSLQAEKQPLESLRTTTRSKKASTSTK